MNWSLMNRHAVRRLCQVCHFSRSTRQTLGTVLKVLRAASALPRPRRVPTLDAPKSSCCHRDLSTIRCLDTNPDDPQDVENQLNQRIQILLASSSWTVEDWLNVQEALNSECVSLGQLLSLVRHVQRLPPPTTLTDDSIRLSLHNAIGLWHNQVFVQPKRERGETSEPYAISFAPREWVDMVSRSPNTFDPLTPSSLSKLVYAAVRSDDMDLAMSLMDQMIMEMTLAYRHSHYGHQHAYDDASSLVQLSIQHMIQAPANVTLEGVLSILAKYQPYLGRNGYNAVLSAMARHGQGEQAEQLLDEMCKGYCVDWTGETIPPDIRSFNLVLSAWSQSRGPSGAERAHAILLRLYDPFDWGALGITPDDVSWNTVLKAWARSARADAVSSAVHVLHEMEEYGRAGMREARPTAVAYGTVLDAMAKKGQAEVAERLWLEMYHGWETDPEWGVAPTWMTAAPVLQAWSLSNRADRTHRAEQWLMRVKDLIPEEPDSAVYHLLLSCYASIATVESSHQAEELLQNMSDPDFASYSIVIHHLAKIPEKVNRAHELFQIVQERYRKGDTSFRPDARSLDSILQSFCKVDHAIATQMLQDVLKDSSSGRIVAPSLKTFGSFMNSFKKSSNPGTPVLAHDIVKAMQHLHRSGVLPQGPDYLIYQSLIVLWTRPDLKIKDSSRTALGILKEFRRKALDGELDQGPTTLDYNLVIRSLTRDFHPVIAHELLEEMVSSRWAGQSRPDAATFHAVQWGWAKIGNANALEHMKVVFRYMDQLGFVHDTVSKNNVIHCLSRMGDLESAENVLKAMKASRDKRTRPSPVSYESVMMGWLKVPNLNRAYGVFTAFDQECERGTYMPLERPYLTMRRALEEAGDHDRAETVTERWRRFQKNQHGRNPERR